MDIAPVSFTLAGFFAQLVDGSLGMGYGVVCSTLLVALGEAPAVVSASVHLAKLFTTASSAYFHYREKNVDIVRLRKLAIPGAVGGIAGATILSNIPGDVIKPWISLYLLVMGTTILFRAIRKKDHDAHEQGSNSFRRLGPLALAGGTVDAIGGGGWGPVVTSTLVAEGGNPRHTIGTVNAAEFFVAAATSLTFAFTLGAVHTSAVIGLVVGGLIASPFAARACKIVRPKPLMVAVGILITTLSASTILTSGFTKHSQQPLETASKEFKDSSRPL